MSVLRLHQLRTTESEEGFSTLFEQGLFFFFRESLTCVSPTAPPPAGGCCAQVKWVITWPLGLLLYCTVPNCVRPRWHRWFMVTFLASTLWIAVFSYLMVWMVRSHRKKERFTTNSVVTGKKTALEVCVAALLETTSPPCRRSPSSATRWTSPTTSWASPSWQRAPAFQTAWQV